VVLRNITKKDVGDLKKWFCNYVHTFKTGDDNQQGNIVLKEEHTLRVCKEILDIGEQLGLDEDGLRLSEIIALFHDIGRFEQYAQYQTFVDSQSVDHSLLGVKILEENNVLCSLDEPVQELILRTIKYHNRATLPREETETCLFFAKLLRDADKLDIWRVVTDYYHQKNGKRNGVIEYGLPDTPEISEEVYYNLMNKKMVNIRHVKNLNDFKLLQIGWVFDINFSPTFQRIKTRRYLDLIRDVLPKSKKIKDIFAVAQSFLDGR
jgi:HD superfamily phosphohydrolase YqeK